MRFKRVNEWKVVFQGLTLVSTSQALPTGITVKQCWETTHLIFIHCISLDSDIYWVMQWMVLGVDVATESQRSKVTSPGPHSWSEAKLDSIWCQSPQLVLLLLATEDGVFLCDYFVTISTSTKNIEERFKIQDFFWAATHLTLCTLFHPPFLLPLQLLDPPQPHSSA